MYCLETHELIYRFSENETVLNGISLKIPKGSIYGFLGPNGAGKTTTLRLVLGLLKKQQGEIFMFGKSIVQNRSAILARTGSLIESPSVYGHLTASENLEVLRKIYQCPKTRIAEVLALVGLQGTGKKKARQFSLGMKQRLSIAIALLHEPELLILDEPTNGLDPNGIIEMRELLKKLNREKGVTIIISSHLLPEIEKLVTHVGIIHKGTLKFQGTMEELNSKQKQASFLVLDTGDAVKTLELVKSAETAACIENGKVVLPALSKEKIAALNRELVQAGIAVYEISPAKNDLESIFMDLIQH